jgi:5,10-methylenetetrahydromethanopterin reductase
MRTSLLTYLGDSQGGGSPVDAYVRDLRAARDQGFDFAWTVQLPWEHDSLITLAVALREVESIRVGTGVQPIQMRHPMALAQEALTLSALSDGRFTLGIGLSHAVVSHGMWGIPGIARCDGSTTTSTACCRC